MNIVWNGRRRNASYFTFLLLTIKRVGLYDCNYSADCLLMCCYEYFMWSFDLWPYHIRFKNVFAHSFFECILMFYSVDAFSRSGSEDILCFAFLFLSKFHITYIIISHKNNRMKRRTCVCMHMFRNIYIYMSLLFSTPLNWVKKTTRRRMVVLQVLNCNLNIWDKYNFIWMIFTLVQQICMWD